MSWNVGALREALNTRLANRADGVHLRVVETSDYVFLAALMRPALPWRERFCQATFGTWGLSEGEVSELMDEVAAQLIIQGKDRGFFVEEQPEAPCDVEPAAFAQEKVEKAIKAFEDATAILKAALD